MNRPTRGFLSALAALCLAVFMLTGASVSLAAEPHYTDETLAQFEQQLNSGQIKSVVINKRLRSLRTTLKNGEYVLAHYEKKGEPAMFARLTGKHVSVTILSSAAAKKEYKEVKPAKHKLRYIVGGAIIVVIVVVGGVLLYNRRRRSHAD